MRETGRMRGQESVCVSGKEREIDRKKDKDKDKDRYRQESERKSLDG